jgi:hypothetical protein
MTVTDLIAQDDEPKIKRAERWAELFCDGRTAMATGKLADKSFIGPKLFVGNRPRPAIGSSAHAQGG